MALLSPTLSSLGGRRGRIPATEVRPGTLIPALLRLENAAYSILIAPEQAFGTRSSMEKSIMIAEDIFGRAIDLPVGSPRDEFVSAQCGGNAALRAEVVSLLCAHEEAEGFLVLPSRS